MTIRALDQDVCPLPALQGYLAHKKLTPPRNLEEAYTSAPMVVLGGGGSLL